MDQNSTSASTTETSDHPGVDVTAERSTDAGRRWSTRRRALVFVVVVLSVFYGIVSWIFSGMILYNSGGEYSEEREASEIAALELDSIDDPEHFTVESSGVPIAGSFYENPARRAAPFSFSTAVAANGPNSSTTSLSSGTVAATPSSTTFGAEATVEATSRASERSTVSTPLRSLNGSQTEPGLPPQTSASSGPVTARAPHW